MAVDGRYDVSVDSPIGRMSATLTLETSGNDLSGVLESAMGKNSFSGGTVNGDVASWESAIGSPMGHVKLAINARVTGDTIAGEVKAGNFGTFSLSGKRI